MRYRVVDLHSAPSKPPSSFRHLPEAAHVSALSPMPIMQGVEENSGAASRVLRAAKHVAGSGCLRLAQHELSLILGSNRRVLRRDASAAPTTWTLSWAPLERRFTSCDSRERYRIVGLHQVLLRLRLGYRPTPYVADTCPPSPHCATRIAQRLGRAWTDSLPIAAGAPVGPRVPPSQGPRTCAPKKARARIDRRLVLGAPCLRMPTRSAPGRSRATTPATSRISMASAAIAHRRVANERSSYRRVYCRDILVCCTIDLAKVFASCRDRSGTAPCARERMREYPALERPLPWFRSFRDLVVSQQQRSFAGHGDAVGAWRAGSSEGRRRLRGGTGRPMGERA